MTSDVRAAAVFDLDNTLVRGSSLFHFGREMVRRRRLKARHVIRFAGAEAGYVLRRGEPTGISLTVAARTLALVAGMRQADLLDLAVEFAETRLHRHLSTEVYRQVVHFKARDTRRSWPPRARRNWLARSRRRWGCPGRSGRSRR